MTPLYMRDLFMKGRGESSLSAKSGELLLSNSSFPPQTGEMVGAGGLGASSSQGEQRHCLIRNFQERNAQEENTEGMGGTGGGGTQRERETREEDPESQASPPPLKVRSS